MAAPAPFSTPPPARPVSSLRGVGAERAAQLARLQICTVEDLLLHRPRRYEDRTRFQPIAELIVNEPALTRGKVVALGVKRWRHGTKSVFELILDDGTARLHCRWWNLPFMERYFATGDEVVVFGKPVSLKPRTMDHPETEVVEAGEENFIHLNRITPVYPLTEGLPQRWLRALIWRTLAEAGASGEGSRDAGLNPPPTARPGAKLRGPLAVPSPLPSDARGTGRGESGATGQDPIRGQSGFRLSRAEAIRKLHFPDATEDIEIARRRLALDEFVEFQSRMIARRRVFESKAAALPCGGTNRLMKPFLSRLGFKLTGAQTSVLREIRGDMSGRHPMRRLLQGDVGSGKTAVAACTALMAIESGFSAALMAPTEILAEQHYGNFRRWLEPLGVGVALQTGSKKLETPGGGTRPPALYIGTHALLSGGFSAPELGLVVIDEQHKFGVSQREELVRKGRYPHLLVMTATPIPRTLGLTIYGDLDISVLNEPPPGRGRVRTFVRTAAQLPKVWDFLREKLREGRQAYVVYPRVDETGERGVKAVRKEHAALGASLKPFSVGLLHGRMRAAEKEEVMEAFRANRLNVLMATSIVEVGIDVPNATLLVIENAELFGLAQLHQLRGRIGRGAGESYCVLVASPESESAWERLRVLEETNDGFRIAEADLRLRGPGELLGQEQSGTAGFRFGDLAEDLDLIQEAREIARTSTP
jgi:ATP-dependent DNA helicase RecG